MKNYSDANLFMLVQQDNERAFAVLYDRYKLALFRHVYKRTGLESEAEEILQNIFISLWRNRHKIVIADALSPYLYGAAKKAVLELYASTKKKLKREHLLSCTEEALDFSVEDHIAAQELEVVLKAEVNRMPSTMKKAFELSRNENLTIKQIASVLEVSEQTVKNNITMAIKILRGKIKTSYLIQITPIAYFLN